MNKKTMAGTALAISLAGAGITAPIAGNSFLGGLVHNGFLAASIGGLADWFAVTALFRKPLGISYRTQILTRNRQRIMQAVVDFAGNDLLNENNIMQYVDKRKLSDMLVLYLEGNERKMIMDNINIIIEESLKKLDYEMLSKKIAPLISAQLQGKQADLLIKNITDEIPVDKVAEELLPFLVEMGHKFLDNEDIALIIKENLAQVLKDYEGNGAGRAFIMGLIGLDADSLWNVIKEKAEAFLNRLEIKESVVEDVSEDGMEITMSAEQGADDEFRQTAIAFLTNQLNKLLKSDYVNNTISNYINSAVNPENIEKMILDILDKQLRQRQEHWQQHIGELAEERLDEFVHNSEWQNTVDAYIKEWLRSQLRSNHHVITGMIEERLAALSDEQLVNFVEPKVSDDLQMIRINGSIVGGLAGMVLFIITYLAGQVLTR